MAHVENHCGAHPDRYAATSVEGKGPVCWECYLGVTEFTKRYKDQAETFYQPGGPGYAGN